jgi:putative transposase
MAAARAYGLAAFEKFIIDLWCKVSEGSEKADAASGYSLLAFYNSPAEHWQHVRSTNPIESPFATVRHRTTRARNCLLRSTFLGLAFKLMEEVEKSRCKIRGADRIKPLLNGVPFKDGLPAPDNQPEKQKLAA